MAQTALEDVSFSIKQIVHGPKHRLFGYIGQSRTSGDLRIDPTPAWNRDNIAVLDSALADDEMRQMFIVRVTVTP